MYIIYVYIMCVHIYIYIHKRVYVFMYVCSCVCVSVCVCVCGVVRREHASFIYVYTCMYVNQFDSLGFFSIDE